MLLGGYVVEHWMMAICLDSTDYMSIHTGKIYRVRQNERVGREFQYVVIVEELTKYTICYPKNRFMLLSELLK